MSDVSIWKPLLSYVSLAVFCYLTSCT